MIYLLAAATLAHIAIFGWMPIRALPQAVLDDGLFISMAHLISSGQWLGDYTSATLAKGPAYPIFIALCHELNLPLSLGHELVHVGACATFALAMRPLAKERWTGAIYLLLLFHPLPWETNVMSRVLRQHLYAPLGLIAMASLIGCVTATKRWATLLWAAIGGLSLGFFQATREESVWIAVPIGVFLALALLFPLRSAPARRTVILRVALLFAFASVPVVLIAGLNRANYGVFTVSEVNGEPFQSAYSALTRVSPENRIRFVPVPRATRAEIYDASPAFDELRPILEGRMGIEAATLSAEVHGEAIRGEVGAGWFIWLLRSAADEAGHYESAQTAAAYFRRLADEVNAACASGKLSCGAPAAGFLPVLSREDAGVLARSFAASVSGFLLMEGSWDRLDPSGGTDEGRARFARMTRSELTPASHRPITFRTRILWLLSWIYRVAGVILAVAVVAALARASIRLARTGRPPGNIAISLSLLTGAATYVAIHALIDAVAFPASGPGSNVIVHAWFLAAAMVLVHEERHAGTVSTSTPIR